HDGLSNFDIGMIFETMLEADWHTYQVLTKRAARMKEAVEGMCRQFGLKVMPNHIWLAVSVEDQARADERIPLLLRTPAAVRWISAEPLLGPVDLTRYLQIGTSVNGRTRSDIQWVVVGG